MRIRNLTLLLWANLLIACLLLAACTPIADPATQPVAEATAADAPSEANTTDDDAEAVVELAGDDGGDPVRQLVIIPTSDGRDLEGYYYRPVAPDSPVIVLMHWARGDLDDWLPYANWLQNVGEPAPDFLPPLADGVHFGVLVFNFSGYGNSEGTGSRDQLYADALAAADFATTLPNADPQRILFLGASIGSDGAIDGCAWLMRADSPGRCIGALSLSPGGYLGYAYNEAAAFIRAADASLPLVCIAAANDGGSPATCRSAGDAVTYLEQNGGAHGMALLTTEHPDVLAALVRFIEDAVGMPITD